MLKERLGRAIPKDKQPTLQSSGGSVYLESWNAFGSWGTLEIDSNANGTIVRATFPISPASRLCDSEHVA
jgi:hypothetical protein